MLLELLGRDEEAFLVRAFYCVFQVAAVGRTKFGVVYGCKLALALLPLDEILADRL